MFHQFRRAQDGTTITEFALAAPIVVALLGGLFEVSRVLFLSALLEWSMADASRFGVTSLPGTEEMPRDQIIAQIVEDRTLGLVDMQDASLETLVYPNFQSIGQAEAFDDENGNGLWDLGEDHDDLPEAFLDMNENEVYDGDSDCTPDDTVEGRLCASGLEETFIDFNENGVYDDGNGGGGREGAMMMVAGEQWRRWVSLEEIK